MDEELLSITYKDFCSVLGIWDKYTYFLLLNDSKISVDTQTPTDTNISACSELLWESLKKGKENAEDILEERFLEEYLHFFSGNDVTDLDKINTFLKLNKSVQIKIIQDGLLPKSLLTNQSEHQNLVQNKKLKK